jgi:hypothetical protein
MPSPIRADKVRAERVDFLWNGRIPRGMISVVAGKPDQGKGLFAARVAADVSNTGERVLYSAAEDDFGKMTKPRLEAAGADLNNILLWRFRLPMQMNELAHIVRENNIKLVVMDPLASHLGGGVSRHSDNIRTVTEPLTDLVESTGASVLIVEHALKRASRAGDPLDVIGGTGSGLPAAARAAYLFGMDPDDGDKRILCKAKFNVGLSPKPLSFELDVDDLLEIGEVPYLEVEKERPEFDWFRLFEGEKKNQDKTIGRPPDKRAAAAEWLTTYLAENGPTLSSTIQEDAKQAGMSVKTLRRAAEDMEVVKDPPGGGRNCTWDLSNEVKDLMGLPTGDGDSLIGPLMEDGRFCTTEAFETGGEQEPEQEAIGGFDPANVTLTDKDLENLLGGGAA